MSLRIDILTLFVEMFDGFLSTSIVGRSIDRGLVEVHRTNIRDFATDNYGTVDDAPYGGGVGMVLIPQPIFDAVEHVRSDAEPGGKVILLTPQGQQLNQKLVASLGSEERLILLSGHYEGFDERIRENLVDMEISVGDYILSGGEVAVMVLIDAMVRLLPGALGKDESVQDESFSAGLLEYPQYTRPQVFREMEVPEVLLSGNHAKIDAWRKEKAIERTKLRRPDLWELWKKKNADE